MFALFLKLFKHLKIPEILRIDTGTSVNTPTVVARAAGLDVPNNATAAATDNSKKCNLKLLLHS